MNDITEKLQEKQRQVLVLLADLNDIEKTVSRLKNELGEIYLEDDKRLNQEYRK